jgi:hypothetical protein
MLKAHVWVIGIWIHLVDDQVRTEGECMPALIFALIPN